MVQAVCHGTRTLLGQSNLVQSRSRNEPRLAEKKNQICLPVICQHSIGPTHADWVSLTNAIFCIPRRFHKMQTPVYTTQQACLWRHRNVWVLDVRAMGTHLVHLCQICPGGLLHNLGINCNQNAVIAFLTAENCWYDSIIFICQARTLERYWFTRTAFATRRLPIHECSSLSICPGNAIGNADRAASKRGQ